MIQSKSKKSEKKPRYFSLMESKQKGRLFAYTDKNQIKNSLASSLFFWYSMQA